MNKIRLEEVSMSLSAQQVEQYHRDGYVCPVPVMPAGRYTCSRT